MGLTGRLLMMNVVFLATTVPSPSIVHVVLAIVVCVRLFFSRCKSPSREGILGCYTATAYFPRSCIASRLLLYVRGAAVCIFSLFLSLSTASSFSFPFRPLFLVPATIPIDKTSSSSYCFARFFSSFLNPFDSFTHLSSGNTGRPDQR